MARRFIDDVRSDISTLLADNTVGAISPADLRSVFNDFVDSSISDQALLNADQEVTGYPVDLTFAQITTGVFTSQVGNEPPFLNCDFANGVISASPTAGFYYEVIGGLSFEAPSNVQVDIVITVDGVPREYIASSTGRGAGRPISATILAQSNPTPANAEFGIAIRAESAGTIDIVDAFLSVNINPTNSP
jgi:hypothetical protein